MTNIKMTEAKFDKLCETLSQDANRLAEKEAEIRILSNLMNKITDAVNSGDIDKMCRIVAENNKPKGLYHTLIGQTHLRDNPEFLATVIENVFKDKVCDIYTGPNNAVFSFLASSGKSYNISWEFLYDRFDFIVANDFFTNLYCVNRKLNTSIENVFDTEEKIASYNNKGILDKLVINGKNFFDKNMPTYGELVADAAAALENNKEVALSLYTQLCEDMENFEHVRNAYKEAAAACEKFGFTIVFKDEKEFIEDESKYIKCVEEAKTVIKEFDNSAEDDASDEGINAE